MRHLPALHRIRRRSVPPAAETLFLGRGGIGLDLGPLFHQLEMRALLQDSGVRGKV